MKNLIAPALTFLIGLAMGALLWKNIDTAPTPKLKDEEAIRQIIQLYSGDNKNDPDPIPPSVQAALDSLTETVSSAVFAFDCRPKENHRITVKAAEHFVDNYLNFPSAMIKHICPSTGADDCTAAQRLHGWRVSYEDITSLSRGSAGRIDSLYLALARHDNGSTPGALTLVVAPLKDNELLLEDNFVLEFMRPCPPRCPNKANGREIPDCSTNPFKQ